MVAKERERGQQKRHAPQPQVDTKTGAWQHFRASAQSTGSRIQQARARAQTQMQKSKHETPESSKTGAKQK